MSFAQFSNNVFDQDRAEPEKVAPRLAEPAQAEAVPSMVPDDEVFTEPSTDLPDSGELERGPSNPGETVPVNGYLPLLLLSAVALIFYYQKKNRKINI
ncbi:hypothetical protein DTW91_10670 [Chryseobacterium sp. SC28]|nr:hypothetical protein DTW91_10670 [Chryseobacterium sp. SC28]